MSFEGFQERYCNCPSGATVFSYQRTGSGFSSGSAQTLPILLLIHGYPQNSLMWKEYIKEIPNEWPVLVIDLPGYGNSTKPIDPSSESRSHSKREFAKDTVHVIDTLFSDSAYFIAFGHDRGARLAYRMAVDFPKRVVGLGVLDIVPTSFVWDAMRLEHKHQETKKSHHWIFLASPRPLPETMIASNAEFYFKFTFLGWTGSKMRNYETEWIQDSILPYLDPVKGKDRIAAACEDYRAGATHDTEDDLSSNINPLYNPSLGPSLVTPPFKCPVLALSSVHLRRRFDVDAVWSSLGEPGFVDSLQVGDEETGHFLVNEVQNEVGERMRAWLGKYWNK